LEELLAGCFRPQAEGDPVAALQRACDLLDETAPLRKTLHQATREGTVQAPAGRSVIEAAIEAGVLQETQGQQLSDAETARRAVIDVDAFDKDQLLPGTDKIR